MAAALLNHLRRHVGLCGLRAAGRWVHGGRWWSWRNLPPWYVKLSVPGRVVDRPFCDD
jgi:hypothetical protein